MKYPGNSGECQMFFEKDNSPSGKTHESVTSVHIVPHNAQPGYSTTIY